MDKKQMMIEVTTGLVSGFVNGIFGGGGGMIVVPMLEKFLKLTKKQAHATAIAIILPLSIFSGVYYLLHGKFPLYNGISVSVGVIIGGIIGAMLLKKLSNKIIGIIFAITMLIAGIKMAGF